MAQAGGGFALPEFSRIFLLDNTHDLGVYQ